MCARILCVVILLSGVVRAEQFLSHLYGVEKQNYVLLCLKATADRRERECSGALLGIEWVGVRAGCLQQHPQERMIALRQTKGERCEDVSTGDSSLRTRGIRDHIYHPWLDLALVLVDRPYLTLDVHPNSTAWTIKRAFQKHGQWRWMRQYMKVAALQRDQHHIYKTLTTGMITERSPILITFLAIVLPTLIYTLVFIYVIFYSSSSKKPCKDLQYNKIKV